MGNRTPVVQTTTEKDPKRIAPQVTRTTVQLPNPGSARQWESRLRHIRAIFDAMPSNTLDDRLKGIEELARQVWQDSGRPAVDLHRPAEAPDWAGGDAKSFNEPQLPHNAAYTSQKGLERYSPAWYAARILESAYELRVYRLTGESDLTALEAIRLGVLVGELVTRARVDQRARSDGATGGRPSHSDRDDELERIARELVAKRADGEYPIASDARTRSGHRRSLHPRLVGPD